MPTTIYDDPNADGSGGYGGFPTGGAGIPMPPFPGPSGAVVNDPPASGGGRSANDLAGLNQKYGFNVDASDVQAYLNGRGSLGDFEARMQARAGNQPGPASQNDGGGASGGRPITSLSQFTDPIGGSVENAAANRANALTNPPNGSGQNLLEQLLKSVSEKFQGGGFTPAEQDVFQTQALDPLERLRTARKQQVMEELSRRGIPPSSGIAQQMLQNVDAQFDSHRATTQRDIAAKGANETTSRMMQAVQLLTQLAGTENNRLDQAFNYQTVPLNLADRSFGQAMQLYSQNNPLSMVQPLLALSQQQQGQSDNQGAALAEFVWRLTHPNG